MMRILTLLLFLLPLALFSDTGIDFDGDGLDDEWEITYFGHIYAKDGTGDFDNDGLTELEEYQNGSHPKDTDTDDDGLTDGVEVHDYNSDPAKKDTDEDSLEDGDEVNTYGTSPTKQDTDNDDLSDPDEINTYGTSPTNDDTDGDTLKDGYELNTFGTDPLLEDTDGDSARDDADTCPLLVNPLQTDSDSDGKGDLCDNCINVANPDQADEDGDGIGSACDSCPAYPSADQSDTDGDGVGDLCDNCLDTPNSGQEDIDMDEIGSACDNCPQIHNVLQADSDSDGTGDKCEDCVPIGQDRDGDGFDDACDNCPDYNHHSQLDSDYDGIGNQCDQCPLGADYYDLDGNGVGDACDMQLVALGGNSFKADGDNFLYGPGYDVDDDDFTIEFSFFYYNKNGRRVLLSQGGLNYEKGWLVDVGALFDEGLRFQTGRGGSVGNGTIQCDEPCIEEGAWSNVAISVKRGEFGEESKIFVNGKVVASGNIRAGDLSHDELVVGAARGLDTDNYFEGRIDELKIWDHARTQEQINDKPYYVLNGDEDGLVSYYRFDQEDGVLAGDMTGNSRVLTLDGWTSPWYNSSHIVVRNTDEDIPLLFQAGYGPEPFSVTHNSTKGYVHDNGDGTVIYTPKPDWNGTDQFTLTLKSNVETVDRVMRIDVNAINDAPRSDPDNYSTDEDTVIIKTSIEGLQQNDYDPESDLFFGTEIESRSELGAVILISAAGHFTYDPNNSEELQRLKEGETVVDRFTYQITDWIDIQTMTPGDSADIPVEITVTGVNDAPVAVDDAVSTGGRPFATIPVILNDYDIENDDLTVEILTSPKEGTYTLNEDLTIYYEPDTDFHGDDEFTYRISDGSAYSQEATVTVHVSRRTDGRICSADDVCLSGFCVDGVCCNRACGGNAKDDCVACSVDAGAQVDGICTVASAQMDIVCRPSIGPCDYPEKCNGVSFDCPQDRVAKSGMPCNDGLFCTGNDTCNAVGQCTHSGDPCIGGEVCMDICDEDAKSCINPDETSCDDGISWTGNDQCMSGVCGGEELFGSCESPIVISDLEDGESMTVIGRPDHLTSYGDNCLENSVDGSDAVHLLKVEAGKTIMVTVDPGSSFDPVIHILSTCEDDSACEQSVNDSGKGKEEVLTIESETEKEFYLVVEGTGNGGYTITVEVSEMTDDEDFDTDEEAVDESADESLDTDMETEMSDGDVPQDDSDKKDSGGGCSLVL